MSNNDNLNAARTAKNDEFYTLLSDIQKEICMYDGQSFRPNPDYAEYFKGKTVLCPCNDADSNFRKFFEDTFDVLQLKKVIAVGYNGNARKVEITADGATETPLSGDGSYDSPECIELLDQCDIVVTNPPFSTMRNFIQLMIEHNKQFLIVGNTNVAMRKEIFPLFVAGSIWYGRNFLKYFTTPVKGELKQFGNVGWYTNIGVYKAPKKLKEPVREYSSAEYPKYDNSDAIEAGRLKNIPKDYDGPIGVSGTYLLAHDPTKYRLLGTNDTLSGPITRADGRLWQKPGAFYLAGKRLYARVIIQKI